MKAITIPLLICSSLLAQTPAAKAPAKKGAASKTGAGKPSLMNPASLNAKGPDTYKAKFTTTKGDFVIEVHRDWAPLGADRFYNLVRAGFFTDIGFFRVHPKFMVQFGISGNPKIAAALSNANIKDDPQKESNKRGTITYAMGGPNTRSTQFFINFVDNNFLDTQNFPPFGTVIEGMDIVDQIYSGYGEIPAMGGTGPSPDKIDSEGNAYLKANFPKLDYIKSAVIVSDAAPATAPAKK